MVTLPNPLRPIGRSWRRLRRRPRAMQLRTVLIVLGGRRRACHLARPRSVGSPGCAAVVPVALVGVDVDADAGEPGQHQHAWRHRPRHQCGLPCGRHQQRGRAVRVRRGQGIQRAGLRHPPLREPDQCRGGIHGRKINPIIVSFDPSNENEMRSLCKQWTQGTPPAFAVVDGIGTWTGDNELCITQEGDTPMIGAWTTITNWTDLGSPYLWWTGADQVPVLTGHRAVGRELRPARAGQEGGGGGVGPGGRPAGAALVPLPDLKKVGITPQVVHDLGRPQRDGQHRLRRPAGGGAPQGGGRPIGDPLAARERLLPLCRGRERRRNTSPNCS